MQLNLHHKIVAAALLPSAVVCALLAAATLWLARSHEHLRHTDAVTLDVRTLALEFSAVLVQAANDARHSALLAAQHPDMPNDRMQDWLQGQLVNNVHLYGSGITYWPAARGGKRKDLYVYRDGSGYARQDETNTYDGSDGTHEWFTLAQKSGKPVWTPPYFDAGAGDAWMVTHSVPFTRQGQFFGVALIDLRLDTLRQIMESQKTISGRWLVLDAAGRIVFADDLRHLGRPLTDFAPAGSPLGALLVQARQQEQGNAVAQWPQQGASHIGWQRIGTSGWLVVLARSDVGGSGVTPEQWQLAGLLVFASLAAFGAFYTMVKRYTGLLGRMADAARRVAEGGQPAPIHYDARDELGALVRSFDGMNQQLQERSQAVSARSHELADRMREQHILYRIAELLGWVDIGFAEVLQRSAQLLPEAWARPEHISARVDLADRRVTSDHFVETARGLFAPIEADGTTVGGVWVFANHADTPLDAGQQELVESVAQQLGLAWRRERAQSQLEKLNHELERRVEARTDALRQAERLLRDITNSMPGAVYQIERRPGHRARLAFVSAGVEKVFGVPRDQALANFDLLLNRIDAADQSELLTHLADATQSAESFTHLSRVHHGISAQTRWIRTSASVFREPDGSALLNGYWIDVTDQKELELELERARRDADAANEAKGRFLANMSHEIRTPMNAIIGLTHLANSGSNEPRVREQLTKVEDSAKTLLGLLNDILDFSKIEAGRLVVERIPFDLWAILDRVEGLMTGRAAEKGLLFSVQRPYDLPRDLVGDPLRLSQVLLNLVSNALKFTEAGSVQVTTVVEETGQRPTLRFAVTDTGVGIDEAQMPGMFTAFSQADTSITRRFGGTGLGLAICRQLVSLMGGEIAVQSRRGEGSTFTFSLPLERADPRWRQALPEPVALAEPQRLAGCRVLLAEDNSINQEIAAELLRQSEVEVVIANNGQEALDLLREGRFDAVLMDLQMPVMDGFTATERIRQQAEWATLPIIAMTANAMSGDRERCLAAGMNDHVPKPFEPAELRATLARWVRKPVA